MTKPSQSAPNLDGLQQAPTDEPIEPVKKNSQILKKENKKKKKTVRNSELG